MASHPLSLLPLPVSYFLGYRASGMTPMSPPPSSLRKALTLVVSFVFTFSGLSILQSISHSEMMFSKEHLPGLISSYGSSSVLVYGIPSSPLAQPRSLIGGHFLSALTGIIISKLLQLLPTAPSIANVNWLGGSLASAIALVVMDLTGTMHPPAGTTALLPMIQADIRDLGWSFLWVVLLSSVLITCVGLVGNNILGRWPVFWFNASENKKKEGLAKSDKGMKGDIGFDNESV